MATSNSNAHFVAAVSGEAQGRLYLGEAAVENEHYNQQYALVANLGNGVGVKWEFVAAVGETIRTWSCVLWWYLIDTVDQICWPV